MPSKRDRAYKALGILLLIGAGLIAAYYLATSVEWFVPWLQSLDFTVSAGNETAAEWIRITVRVSGGSYDRALAAYALSGTSRSYWLVDDTYYVEQKIHLKVRVTIEYQNVHDIKIADTYIKAVDANDDTKNYKYDFADNVAVSGPSPITWDSSEIVKAIETHIRTDLGCTWNNGQINYIVYCVVNAVGDYTGYTYTAELTETQFASHNYEYVTESLSGEVTPEVTFSSWIADGLVIGGASAIVMAVIGAIFVLRGGGGRVRRARVARRRGKRKRKR